MTQDQILLVQKSWPGISNRLDTIGEQFYENLFEAAPHLKKLFVTSKELQGSKFMQLVGLHVTKLHLKDEPDETLASLGKRHLAYGVKDEYFDTFGQTLIKTLRDEMGSELWNPELEAAWAEAYRQLSALMQKGMHQE